MKDVLNIILPDRLYSLLIEEEQPKMKDHVGCVRTIQQLLPHILFTPSSQNERRQKQRLSKESNNSNPQFLMLKVAHDSFKSSASRVLVVETFHFADVSC